MKASLPASINASSTSLADRPQIIGSMMPLARIARTVSVPRSCLFTDAMYWSMKIRSNPFFSPSSCFVNISIAVSPLEASETFHVGLSFFKVLEKSLRRTISSSTKRTERFSGSSCSGGSSTLSSFSPCSSVIERPCSVGGLDESSFWLLVAVMAPSMLMLKEDKLDWKHVVLAVSPDDDDALFESVGDGGPGKKSSGDGGRGNE
mmetsp:Transcript_3908/g.9467  ORF Transcript_3908/g.9467 Transcript_3908/m.9467 type:complete len:205 (+) Transcript_3908:1693-2307(+)